jgi:hypothetical protein
MRCLDPGHLYELAVLDGGAVQELRFVKRIGERYAGNEAPGYAGTNCQEVTRALIDRSRYLGGQFWCIETALAILAYRFALWLFELRAARLHRRWPPWRLMGEQCGECGHLVCRHRRV